MFKLAPSTKTFYLYSSHILTKNASVANTSTYQDVDPNSIPGVEGVVYNLEQYDVDPVTGRRPYIRFSKG